MLCIQGGHHGLTEDTLKILNSVLSMDEYGYTSAETLLLQIKSQCASYVFFSSV